MTIEQLVSLVIDKGVTAAIALFVLVRIEPAIKELHGCIDALRDEIRQFPRR